MTQEEYDSDYYQTYRKAKVCLDVVTGLVTLPKLAVGLTKFTKSAILGSVRLGQKYIRNGKHVILAFAIRNSVRNAKLGNTLPNATALMREVAECVRTGKVYVFGETNIFTHMPSSGVIITANAKQGTFLVGSFDSDLKTILEELNYPIITDYNLLRPSSSPLYLTPQGYKFNLLNVSKEVVDYFSKKGGFFNIVNAKWVDAAVIQNADVIIVSKLDDLYSAPGKLSGFGKEVHRFEWKHGYRYDPKTKMMLPPNKANGLPTRTLQNENIIVD